MNTVEQISVPTIHELIRRAKFALLKAQLLSPIIYIVIGEKPQRELHGIVEGIQRL